MGAESLEEAFHGVLRAATDMRIMGQEEERLGVNPTKQVAEKEAVTMDAARALALAAVEAAHPDHADCRCGACALYRSTKARIARLGR